MKLKLISVQNRLLATLTTKNMEYTQKKWERNQKRVITKNQLHTKEYNKGKKWRSKKLKDTENNKIARITPPLSVITLKVNRLNSRIKSNSLAEWINSTQQYAVYRTHLKSKDTHRSKVKLWKKIFHANSNHKGWETMLISDKIDFNSTTVKNKEIMIKGSIHHICTKHQSS